MALKRAISVWATFLSILVQFVLAEPKTALTILLTPAMSNAALKPRFDSPRATFAIATFALPSPLTASATVKLSQNFPLAKPRVSLRAVNSPECYYPDVSESLFCGGKRLGSS
jgi:hypothetical protein